MTTGVGRLRTTIAAYAVLATLVAVVLPAMTEAARANHGTRTLDLIPEQTGNGSQAADGPFTGDAVIITAKVSQAAVDGPINIDAEHEAGANDPDKSDTPGSPDYTCTIPVGLDFCELQYTGTQATGNTSQDVIRAWIDHDGFQSTVEADLLEGRTASQKDCEQEEGGPDPVACPPISDAYEPGTGGTNCEATRTNPLAEPDCTDVVRVDYDNRSSIPSKLDCDDSGGPNTEQETNAEEDSETYVCRVFDQFGSGLNGIRINGENESGVNDPDPVDGDSKDSPDYGCSATANDPRDPIFGGAGYCLITVEASETELGKATICWWAGDVASGPSLCASETVLENAEANGSDSANDLADRTELTWEDASTFVIDCTPETDSNPVGSSHTVTCEAKSQISGLPISGQLIEVEITGAGDPDQTNSLATPDRTCTTATDGKCSFTHSSTTAGDTTYRAWVQDGDTEPPRSDGSDPDIDRTEGQSESSAPGEFSEPDATDVVTKTWSAAPSTLTMEPESDSANVGECNPFTITLTTGSGQNAQPVVNATIDVEQRHANSANNVNNDEPATEFCTPASGPNPSDVDTTKGDLGPNSAQTSDRENPDNPGTAGGETVKQTDSNGQVTIGIKVTPASGSDGSGEVTVTAFFDSTENDDPDTAEPKDTSTKTWNSPGSADPRVIDCEPETVTKQTGESHTITCTVTNRSGQPVSGESVTFTEEGAGTISSQSTTTNQQGQATVTATSTEAGTQTVTGTLTDDTQNEPDNDECDRAANDPSGSPTGACSDSVTVTWQETPASQCSDGEDNDGDGHTDFPDDPGCESSEDDDETDPQPETCPGFENAGGNQIVGTDEGETIQGTEGDDIICALGGDDQVFGNGGNDIILGGAGDDVVLGGEGGDEIEGNGGNDTLSGDQGNDEIVGGPGDDTIEGNGGRDILIGSGGNDTIAGGGGNDILKGGTGNDTLKGGSGNDRINGGSGKDRCSGGPGKDRITHCEKGDKRRR